MVTTAGGMFEAICNHIKYATNKGNIRSAITIFPQRTDGKHDYRIWNSQLISFAGYKQPDGTYIGDPINVEFTSICLSLGWKGKKEEWEILPIVLSANGHDPEYFDLPSELVIRIKITHPKYKTFEQLNLQWYAVPAVSNMLFDVGGLEFPAAPFNGWYMATEIASRNFGDIHRYNMLEKVASILELNTQAVASLWKDKAMVELNIAVLHSFQNMNVTIVDHHTASESFLKHMENEQRLRGGCPADWVWIVPPVSGSATAVFHQEMLNYSLKPSYEYQEVGWKTHIWKKGKNNVERKKSTKKFHFKEIARAVKFTSKLFGKALSRRIKATIVYATETGKSEIYAKTLESIFSHAFNTQIFCMSEYDIINLDHEALLLVVTSTFGNGDPPENGEDFANNLYAMKVDLSASSEQINSNQSKSFIKMNSQSDINYPVKEDEAMNRGKLMDLEQLGNLRFAVFALGSSAYPNFCAFGKYVDNLLAELGGERLLQLMTGDELCGQNQAFRIWAKKVFHEACDVFCVGDDISHEDVVAALQSDTNVLSGKIRLVESSKSSKQDLRSDLSKLYNKQIVETHLISRNYIPLNGTSDQTILIKLDWSRDLSFLPGDHIGICSVNRAELVDRILKRLNNLPQMDCIVEIQILDEKQTIYGPSKTWIKQDRLPSCTAKTAIERYLDICSPPTPQLLELFASLATSEEDKNTLTQLANNSNEYEDWKHRYYSNICEVLEQFPSVNIDAVALLNALPILQPRFYSISSSPMVFNNQIHLTVGLLKYHVSDDPTKYHYGVCSGFLNLVKHSDPIYCFIRNAPTFHLPDNLHCPIVLVGPGTGIAPFRGFWQEKEYLVNKLGTEQLWPMSLYYGCHNENMNLYNTELAICQAKKILQNVYTAFSRIDGKTKMHVQNLMFDNADELLSQIYVNRGHIYVCGDVSMAEDVNLTLRLILSSSGGLTKEEADTYVLSMRDENRYHEDIFGVNFRNKCKTIAKQMN
uniref:nitric-oxide synthase (NADPH) n=1 Tax=Strigamia maritima TaxID=126957 RepID=T1JE55_STRMM